MAVFKKLRKNKDKSLPLPEPEAVKPLDKRVGIESYRKIEHWIFSFQLEGSKSRTQIERILKKFKNKKKS
ncbi:Protein CBG24801 [Caenorhabditis briggsae]|uniref:Protein CBG24801 n=1 Tax=Caenorhabditis briggsae TaxID=6238 RepID=A8WLI5_CAEBR|nr:Protein CBG24801 [Caenorhabditis briggsae]CAP21330.1 Protein CBG24801 [Caenorhabditis briggsae]